jgi:hypothetical protein
MLVSQLKSWGVDGKREVMEDGAIIESPPRREATSWEGEAGVCVNWVGGSGRQTSGESGNTEKKRIRPDLPSQFRQVTIEFSIVISLRVHLISRLHIEITFSFVDIF